MATTTRNRLEIAGLGAVLALAAALRLWRLEANGFGTEYYAAGVRSALQGFSLLFYNSFDPAGFISLDKPPVAFWIQALFAWALGFSGWAIHLPQALAGIASVALLYRLVRPPFGAAAAGGLCAVAAAVRAGAPAIRRRRGDRRRAGDGADAGRGRDRPLQQHRFVAGALPAAGRLGGLARPRRIAGRGDGAAGRRLQREDAGRAGLRPRPAGRLVALQHARLAPAARLDGGRRHDPGRGVAVLAG